MERLVITSREEASDALLPTFAKEKHPKAVTSSVHFSPPATSAQEGHHEIPFLKFHENLHRSNVSLNEGKEANTTGPPKHKIEKDTEVVSQSEGDSVRNISNRNDPFTAIVRFGSALGQELGCIKLKVDQEDINLSTDLNTHLSTDTELENNTDGEPAESFKELTNSALETFVSYLPRVLQFIAYDCFGVRQIGGGGSDDDLSDTEVNYGVTIELMASKRELLSRVSHIDTYVKHFRGKRKRVEVPSAPSNSKRRRLSISKEEQNSIAGDAYNGKEGSSFEGLHSQSESESLQEENDEAHSRYQPRNPMNEDSSSMDIPSRSNEVGERQIGAESTLKLGDKFDDFEALETAVNEFKLKSLTHLKKIHANKNPSKVDDLNKFPFRCVTYTCTHGGDVKSRSKNIRPGQSYYATKCPMKIYVKLQKDSIANAKFYEITIIDTVHEGHDVSKEAFALHIQGRRPSAEEKENILRYREMKVPTREIRKDLYNRTGKNLSSQDVGNIERQAKKEAGDLESDIKETLALLKETHEADIGSTLKIVYSEEEETNGKSIVKIIFWQSSSQKAALKKNGQLICIDGTYKLTNLDYVLYPILVVDEHRKTKLIAWALLSNEKRSVLNEFLQIFADANPTASSRIKFVTIDKSFNEIAALGTVLPSAKFILCRVHVLKAVNENIRKIRLPSGKQLLKEELERLFRKMVHSPKENNYQDAWEDILHLANENPELEKFARYLEVNWHSCRDHFAECKVGRLHHFNTKTNNRSENFNMQLKQRMRKQSRIPNVVKALLDVEDDQRRKTAMRDYESLCKQYKPVNLDNNTRAAELLQIGRKVVTKEALKLMQIQCELSTKISEDELKKDMEQIDCTNLEGECVFYSNYKLPCKHLFATRNFNGENVFDIKMIPRHWLINKNLAENKVDEPKDDVVFTKSKSSSTLASGYNASKADLQDLQETLTKCSKVDQEIYVKMIRTMTEALKKKRTVTFDDGEMYVETKDEDCIRANLSSGNIEDTLEFSSARKSHKKSEGHTVLKRKKREHYSAQKEKCNSAGLQVAEVGDSLPSWMRNINQKMKNLGAIDEWAQHDYDILSNRPDLEGANLWLSDSHFHYFTILFNHQFNAFQKMQCTLLADCATGLMKINEKEDFIQPVHAGDHHWAMVTNIGVPPQERDFTVIAYDSLISMVSKEQCEIREKMKWQAVQLLRPETQGYRKGMVMFVKPCHQQPNGNDCGLFAIANCVALAFGHDPSTIYYTGNLRQEFLQMVKETKISMFSFQQRSISNEKAFFTNIPMSPHSYIFSQVPEIKHSFDIVCHCGMPLSWGNTVDCDSCKETYHIQCYLVNNESKIFNQLREFCCYRCRRPGCYDFLQMNITENGDSKDRIAQMANSIRSMQSSKLRIHLPSVLNHKQDNNHFITMNNYLKFEALLAKYDLNSVAQRVGEIYHALNEYYHRSSAEVRGAASWSKMSEAQIVHLAVLLICDVTKTKLPPLINVKQQGEILKVLSDDELLKKNKKWIGVLEKIMCKVKSKTKSLLHKKITYAKAMPEISTLRKELSDLSEQTHSILDGLGKGRTSEAENTKSQFKCGQISSLNNILIDHKECTEDLNTIQKR